MVTRRLNTVCDALRRKYPGESFVPAADNSPLPEREAAWLVGIGLRGKNGLLILPPYGSYVFLGTILTLSLIHIWWRGEWALGRRPTARRGAGPGGPSRP